MFYFRFPAVVHAHLTEYGILGAIIGIFGLFFVAAFSDVWTLACKSANYQAAITTGLAVPGLIMSAGVALSGSNNIETASFFPYLSANVEESSLIGDSLRMIFAPVNTVIKVEYTQKIRILKKENTTLSREIESKEKMRIEQQKAMDRIISNHCNINDAYDRMREKAQSRDRKDRIQGIFGLGILHRNVEDRNRIEIEGILKKSARADRDPDIREFASQTLRRID